MQLILASSSQPRKMLLERLKVQFNIAHPNVDETPLPNEKPIDLVARLAKEKAHAAQANHTNALIIGSDQVGIIDNTILCKPLSIEKAIQQLQLISGKNITFLTGLCLLNTHDNTYQISVEKFEVTFKKLSLEKIESYLKKDNVLNCAGSFSVEGLGITLVKSMKGEDYTALIGLPLIRLTEMFDKAGFDLLDKISFNNN